MCKRGVLKRKSIGDNERGIIEIGKLHDRNPPLTVCTTNQDLRESIIAGVLSAIFQIYIFKLHGIFVFGIARWPIVSVT